MDEKIIKFDETEIEKHKIIVSNKVYFGKKVFKCFIGYNDG